MINDSSKANSWIMYFNANNLYGWVMMQQIHFRGFQRVDISIDKVLATPDGNNEGIVVEVGIEYPEHLHDTYSDYPLVPEAISNLEPWLGDYQ